MKLFTSILFLFSPVFLFSQGVIVNGGFLILQPTAQVIITSNGNWTNNATATCNTGSWVRMSGNAIQTIQGSQTTAFSNLDINNTNAVNVGKNITVNDALQMTQGYFDLKSFPVTFSSTANVTGGETETKRIRSTDGGGLEGQGTGIITTTRDNPSGNVANLGLNFTPTVALGNNTVFIRGHERQTGMGNFSIYRYYDIQPTVQSNVTINSFNYFTAELGSQAAFEADLLMFQWITDPVLTWWQPRPTTVFPASNYVVSNTSTNILTHYKITLASTDLPLPIELLSFKAECNNGQNNLIWETASEQNNDFFTLEKSFDGENFSEFTQVPSQGNSNVTQSYSAIDFTPFYGTNYYRLKQTDLDGQFNYSDIISLRCNSINYNEDILPISPSNGTVDALLQGIPGNKYQIKLTNVLGQVIINKEITLSDYQQSIKIYDNNLAIGMYYVIMLTESKNISKPLIIYQH